MFANFKRLILGIPPGSSTASFQPVKAPERARKFWREDEISEFGRPDEMVARGVVTLWRSDPSGRRWFKGTCEALSWWKEIND